MVKEINDTETTLISLKASILLFSFILSILKSCSRHLFFNATKLEKIVFQTLYVLEQQIVFLLKKNNGDIGDSFISALLNRLTIVCRIIVLRAHDSGLNKSVIVIFPLLQPTHAQIIFVINKQFLKTGLGHIGKFDF